MKNTFSFLSILLIGAVLLCYRFSYPKPQSGEELKLTTWDAYGYYLYLPSTLLYHDVRELSFQDSIEAKYHFSGGNFYQANRSEESGHYVFKYLGGVAIMHLPLFAIAHAYALNSSVYAADGFSLPYQTAIGFGIVFYTILALFVLRKVLLKYFSDTVSAITLVLLMLASNAIQYVSIDSAQSHAPIFLLYCLVLYFTIKWHENPKLSTAFITGYIIGLATISRPTEAIMVLIPILWNTQDKESAKEKWALVKSHMPMVYLAALGGLLGILPQLLYWKYVSNHFIYDVGSAWRFLSPFFRVLFGFEKGWFVYTPVTLFFVIGLFFMKGKPFQKAVIWFCALNIWIIISWSDWKYGGSYSTRALMQSYPVFALAFASFISKAWESKWKWLIFPIGFYLLGVNLFQIKQYNQTVLHYYDMNRAYYGQIYLNPTPTPLQKSLMDNPDWISNEDDYAECIIHDAQNLGTKTFYRDSLNLLYAFDPKLKGVDYLKIEAQLLSPASGGYLQSELIKGDSVKVNRMRILYPQSKANQLNEYAFYCEVPAYFADALLRVRVVANDSSQSLVPVLKITGLTLAK